jgi:hypothetical protein
MCRNVRDGGASTRGAGWRRHREALIAALLRTPRRHFNAISVETTLGALRKENAQVRWVRSGGCAAGDLNPEPAD